MENENVFMLYAFFMGIYITFVYDFLRIFRRVIPHKSWAIALEDLGFWAYCAGTVFLFLYRESNGVLRWFAVLGAVLGIIIYRKTVSPLFVKYVSFLLKWFVGLLVKGLTVVLGPFRKVTVRLGNNARKWSVRAKERGRRSLKKRLTFLVKMLRMIV